MIRKSFHGAPSSLTKTEVPFVLKLKFFPRRALINKYGFIINADPEFKFCFVCALYLVHSNTKICWIYKLFRSVFLKRLGLVFLVFSHAVSHLGVRHVSTNTFFRRLKVGVDWHYGG